MAEQLSFNAIFEQAALEERTRHLPTEMEDGIAVYRQLVERYHATVLAGDWEAAEVLIEEAHHLAVRLNGGDPAILGGSNASARVLERETAAPDGQVPLWGQTGSFLVQPCKGMLARIEMDGLFGLCGGLYPTFAVHAVNPDAPFLSETGYRSFHGWRFPVEPGMTTAAYAEAIIRDYVQRVRKGKLCRIDAAYRDRFQQPQDHLEPT